MTRRCAALPVIDVIENHVELLAAESRLQRRRIVAVRSDVGHAPAEIVPRAAVQNGDGMLLFEEGGHKSPADISRSPDDQAVHASSFARTAWRGRVNRNIPDRDE